MAKNAYTRERYERKPQNRFITITNGSSFDNTYIAKVHFNKELDAKKLRNKINKAIDDYNERIASVAKREETDRANTISIASHYLADDDIKNAVECIHIEKGIITFRFKDYFSVKFKASGEFMSLSFYVKEITTNDEVTSFVDSIGDKAWKFEEIFTKIFLYNKLPENLVDWAQTQYNKYFYSSTMSTER
jgi:hypothetical protein